MTTAKQTDQPISVLWFKRDLRLRDHAALVAAAQSGSVLPIYVYEPGYWALPDTSYRQWKFLRDTLAALGDEVAELGGQLSIYSGDVVHTFQTLRGKHGPFRLFAHEETGNAWTFQRDKAVRHWCRKNNLEFHEFRQFGVWRGPDVNRDTWAKQWDAMMTKPVLTRPDRIEWVKAGQTSVPDAADLDLSHDGIQDFQKGGRDAALSDLNSFLYQRGEPYQKAMSSPIDGAIACSRISTHLTLGSLSMKGVYQEVLKRQAELSAMPPAARGDWPKAMRSFAARLHWHCHFIQKFETEPEIEFRPMARRYEGLRQNPGNPGHLSAFEMGQTGFPFVDACMRSLRATGWINFRMRAMLMSFATYNLWLPWQQAGMVLARYFTDYEPGIHWSQCQMQAGETGINTVRIYSPIKQGYDQDKSGTFIRKWVPELANLEGKALHEPWAHAAPLNGYPDPIVDYKATTKVAKDKIYSLRTTAEAREEARRVYIKHGSRKRPEERNPKSRRPKNKKGAQTAPSQISFDFGLD